MMRDEWAERELLLGRRGRGVTASLALARGGRQIGQEGEVGRRSRLGESGVGRWGCTTLRGGRGGIIDAAGGGELQQGSRVGASVIDETRVADCHVVVAEGRMGEVERRRVEVGGSERFGGQQVLQSASVSESSHVSNIE